jgi:hypothetical protein
MLLRSTPAGWAFHRCGSKSRRYIAGSVVVAVAMLFGHSNVAHWLPPFHFVPKNRFQPNGLGLGYALKEVAFISWPNAGEKVVARTFSSALVLLWIGRLESLPHKFVRCGKII